MSDDQGRDSLNRRNFIVTAIGASAALAASAGAPSTRAATASPGTIFTGDTIDGKKIVSALDIDDLEPGKKHLLYFQGVEMPTGQHWYVSVTAAKGAEPGKRGVLTSGVHGDETSINALCRTPGYTAAFLQSAAQSTTAPSPWSTPVSIDEKGFEGSQVSADLFADLSCSEPTFSRH